MSQDQVEKLFENGKVTSSEGTRGEKGTGFGLPLAKTVAEAMDGTINIESTVGEGTSVIVLLPKARVASIDQVA